MMNKRSLGALVAVAVACAATPAVAADPVSIQAVLELKESIRMDFHDGSPHFVVMVRRQGKAEGKGALSGAEVTEYGWHDIKRPVGADPHGYLQFKTANGDIANVKWNVRAVFFKGEKKPKLADYGYWELVSGTGQFAGHTGVGTLTIKPKSKKERIFTLTGEIGKRP